jgi:hypothetical protein
MEVLYNQKRRISIIEREFNILEWSENNLKKSLEKYRLNSLEGEITKEEYIRINNTSMSAEEVAKVIKDKFQL